MAGEISSGLDESITWLRAYQILANEHLLVGAIEDSERCARSHRSRAPIPPGVLFSDADLPFYLCGGCFNLLVDRRATEQILFAATAFCRNLDFAEKRSFRLALTYKKWLLLLGLDSICSNPEDPFQVLRKQEQDRPEHREREELEKSRKLEIYCLIVILILSRKLGSSNTKSLISGRRRPPPRTRRRSCASVNNPRPQPSLFSENLSRFAVSVCKSARPLASYGY